MPPHIWAFDAIGTAWQVETPSPLAPAVRDAVTDRIETYDRAWSRFRDDSLVTTIATTPGRHVLPPEAPSLFSLYRRLYELTAGTVSPLVGGSLEALGYDRTYSLTAGAPRPAPSWDAAVAWDGEALSTARPVTVDVGAAGKGQLVDLVGETLRDSGINEWLVDAGGDMRRSGTGTIRVGLEHPLDASRAIGVVELGTGAVCASALNRRAWGPGLHHVLDATTGLPVNRVLATWVMADDAMTADGLATALFFASSTADALAWGESFGTQWVRMLDTGVLETSRDYLGEVFR